MKQFVAIAVLLLGLAMNATAANVGDKVPYVRHDEAKGVQGNFHAELYTVVGNVDGVYKTRAGKAHPESYAYPLLRAAVKGDGVRFAECATMSVLVRVSGLTDGKSFAKTELDVLDKNDIKIGTVAVADVGDDWFELTLDVAQPRAVVIPYRFAKGKRPVSKITPVNFVATGPFFTNGSYSYDMTHRVFPNTDKANAKDNRTNVGMLLPIVAVKGEKEGTCKRP